MQIVILKSDGLYVTEVVIPDLKIKAILYYGRIFLRKNDATYEEDSLYVVPKWGEEEVCF